MARLPLVREDDPSTPTETRDLLDVIAARRALAEAPNFLRALANAPELLRTFMEFSMATRDPDGLTPVQYELAYLSASVVNSCFY